MGQHFLLPPLTLPDVVEQSLEYCMKVSEAVGYEFTVHTCDQGIYDITLGLCEIVSVQVLIHLVQFLASVLLIQRSVQEYCLQLMVSSELRDTNYNLVYRLSECKLNNGDVIINIL